MSGKALERTEVVWERKPPIAFYRTLYDSVGRDWQWLERKRLRVWLHTCSLDHQAALPNYLKAGFVVFDEQTTDHEIVSQ